MRAALGPSRKAMLWMEVVADVARHTKFFTIATLPTSSVLHEREIGEEEERTRIENTKMVGQLSTHREPNDSKQLLHSKVITECLLSSHHIAIRDMREIGSSERWGSVTRGRTLLSRVS
jgi:hypothetical protein